MAQGRDQAQAMLAADMSGLANRIGSDAARVGAASRGTTYEIEQAKQQQNLAYSAFLDKQDRHTGRASGQPPVGSPEPLTKVNGKPAGASSQKGSHATTAGSISQLGTDQVVRRSAEDTDQDAAERRAHEQSVKRTMDEIERKRALAAQAAKHKTEQAKEAQDLTRAKQQFLAQMRDKTRLVARTCPDGEGKHYIVGLKPEVVECLDVSFTASCRGTQQSSRG